MKFDKINFICDAVKNEYYGTLEDDYLTQDHRDLLITVVINDVRIGWRGHVDPYALVLRSLDHSVVWDGKVIEGYSGFEPFTCSCGDGGCAGIWDGIYIKERGHSIEWRAKANDGYGFLQKSFFNFEKSQYKKAFDQLLSDIRSLSENGEYTLVVDPGHCEEGMVIGKDFLKYVEGKL